MNEQTIEQLRGIDKRLTHMKKYLDIEVKEKELVDLEKKMEETSFWDSPKKAQEVIDRAKVLKLWTVPYKEICARFSGVSTLLPEVNPESDGEFYQELLTELKSIEEALEELEVRKMLSGELDPSSCFLSINAGAGGTEACDWALMLVRMYDRWATRRGWKVSLIDRVDGEIAGIRSQTIKITGSYAYGYCKAEKGVHRLVRISPFDSNARRHTSFASVDVTPEIDETVEVEVRPDEIRIDTFRSSGAGGQHVNTTDSAVRITHLETGIVISCQSERSQLQNRETCLKMLKSKIYEKQCLEREQKLREISGEKKENAWGSQIRNYVFQPYTLVKDARTKYEVGNIEAVMDGDLDGFIHAYLKEFG